MLIAAFSLFQRKQKNSYDDLSHLALGVNLYFYYIFDPIYFKHCYIITFLFNVAKI